MCVGGGGQILSVFNFNLELAVPECAIPTFGAVNKWFFVEFLPVAACSIFLSLHIAIYLYKRFIKRTDRKWYHSHVSTMVSSVIIMVYVLYLYITRTTLDIFNCSPTDPPDGHIYLEIVFEECGVPGGIQLRLMPYAITSLVVVTVAYPLGVAALLFVNRDKVYTDQVCWARLCMDAVRVRARVLTGVCVCVFVCVCVCVCVCVGGGDRSCALLAWVPGRPPRLMGLLSSG